jgi:uncharacterized membrane protein
MTLQSNKNLSFIGSLLILLGLLGFIFEPLFAIASFVGFILLLAGLHGLSDYYKDRAIFNNGLFAFIALIIGVVVTVAGFVYLFFLTTFGTDLMALLYPGFTGDWTNLPNLTFDANLEPTVLIPYIGPIVEVFAIMWIFTMVAGFLGWQALKGLSKKVSVGLFSTAGMLLFIGAVLTIMVIGVFLIIVAVLLMTIAFFQLKPQPEPPVTSPVSPQPVGV